MDSGPRREKGNNTERYLRQVQDAYALNKTSGLYEPKTQDDETGPPEQAEAANRVTPLEIHVMRDWPAIIISGLTLAFLVATVIYTRRQWLQANRSANAAEIAAAATHTAAEAARKANVLTEQIVKGSEAAVISPFATPGAIGNLSSIDTGIAIEFANNGKINATKFTSHESLARLSLPDYKPIGRMLFSSIKKDQIIPTSQIQGQGADQVAVSTFDTRDFTVNDIELVKSMKETFKTEGEFQYDNGFGDIVNSKFCFLYVSLHNPDGSSSEGWVSCEEAQSAVSGTLRRQERANVSRKQQNYTMPSANTMTLPNR